jgi:hypothetical protein
MAKARAVPAESDEMKKQRPAEGLEECVARELVALELNVEVSRYDDGSADNQPDALIHFPTGPVPLEVVRDHDVAFNRFDNAARKIGWSVITSPDQPGWYVSLRHTADLRHVRAQLPALLQDLPVHWFQSESTPGDAVFLQDDREYALASYLLERLGVVFLQPLPEKAGVIRLTAEGWYSWDDPIELIPWISRVLTREYDVSEKLAKHGGAQRHAFIWTSTGSPWSVNSMLRHDDDDEPSVPHEPPQLPSGVTHLWVASSMSRRDLLYWSPEDGWKRAKGLPI